MGNWVMLGIIHTSQTTFTWQLGDGGDSCIQTCRAKHGTCHGEWSRESGIFEMMHAVRAATGKHCILDSEPWDNALSPAFAPSGSSGELNRCLGVVSLPHTIDCKSHAPEYMRWCNCYHNVNWRLGQPGLSCSQTCGALNG